MSCSALAAGARLSAFRPPFTVYRSSHGGEGLKRLDLEVLASSSFRILNLRAGLKGLDFGVLVSSSFRILTLGAGLKGLDFEVLSFGSTRKIVISS